MQNINEDTNKKRKLCALVCANIEPYVVQPYTIYGILRPASTELTLSTPQETPSIPPDKNSPVPVKEPPQSPVPEEVPSSEPYKIPPPPISPVGIFG